MRNMEKLLMLAVLGICTGVVGAELAASQRGTLSRQLLSAQHTAGQAENLVREANKLFLEDKYQEAIARYIENEIIYFFRDLVGKFIRYDPFCPRYVRCNAYACSRIFLIKLE